MRTPKPLRRAPRVPVTKEKRDRMTVQRMDTVGLVVDAQNDRADTEHRGRSYAERYRDYCVRQPLPPGTFLSTGAGDPFLRCRERPDESSVRVGLDVLDSDRLRESEPSPQDRRDESLRRQVQAVV